MSLLILMEAVDFLKSASLRSSERMLRSKATGEIQSCVADGKLNYCSKLTADGVGQRRVSAVVLRPDPPARKVQHSPSVEQ